MLERRCRTMVLLIAGLAASALAKAPLLAQTAQEGAAPPVANAEVSLPRRVVRAQPPSVLGRGRTPFAHGEVPRPEPLAEPVATIGLGREVTAVVRRDTRHGCLAGELVLVSVVGAGSHERPQGGVAVV